MRVTTEIRVEQLEIMRTYMLDDLDRVTLHLRNCWLDFDPQMKLLSRRGKLYDQIMQLDNKLKREYKVLEQEQKEEAKQALAEANLVTEAHEVETEAETETETEAPSEEEFQITEFPANLETKSIIGLRPAKRHNKQRRPAHIRNR